MKIKANQNTIINDCTVQNKRAGTQSHLGKKSAYDGTGLTENEIFYSSPLEINLSAGFSRMQQNTRHGTSNNLIITEITADLFWEHFG